MLSWLGGLFEANRKHHGPSLSRSVLEGWLDKLLASKDGGLEPFILPPHTLKRICAAARDELLKEKALLQLPVEPGADTIVVGDLHGQYCDLQRILKECGPPRQERRYLLLGDFIDRGPQGLEIVATIFILKLLYPSYVYLLRGNHECTEITVLFGFCGECQRRSNLEAWEAVMKVFDALPLVALLGGRVMCVHGGLSPLLERLEQIDEIERPADITPSGVGLVYDLLWSDPSPTVDTWCSNPRGVSFVFGLTAAREVMGRLGVRTVVRAHMMHTQGYAVLGDNEVITVFSAANYRGCGNRGAVLLIDGDLSITVKTYEGSGEVNPVAVEAAAAAAAAVEAGAGAGKAAAVRAGAPPRLPPLPLQQATAPLTEEQQRERQVAERERQQLQAAAAAAHSPPPALAAAAAATELQEILENAVALQRVSSRQELEQRPAGGTAEAAAAERVVSYLSRRSAGETDAGAEQLAHLVRKSPVPVNELAAAEPEGPEPDFAERVREVFGADASPAEAAAGARSL